MLRYLSAWPRVLITLPFAVRLSMFMVCIPLCLGFYILTFPVTHNGNILAVPMALSAWIFKKRGVFIFLVGGLIVLIIYHTIRLGSILWPFAFTLSFCGGFFILVLEGIIVTSLRNFIDSAEDVRLKALQSEQQIALAYEQQRRLHLLKREFMLNVNHELRTPLTTLYGYLELFQLVMEQDGKLDRAIHGPFLKNAVQSCEKLKSLIETIVDTMRLGHEREALKMEAFSVAGVVADVIEQIDACERGEHRVELDIPTQLAVQADEQYVRHVLRHLLSNAFKYSPACTTVVVEADQAADDAQKVCISVQDAGSGIPQDEIPLLFGQFARLKRDIAGSVRGTGLGLYVSKQLVEAMNGRIWVESTGIPGQGSRFCFTLPCAVPL